VHWIDVALFTVLVGLSSGTSSIFFLAYLFPVLVASFRGGFSAGIQVTVVSAVLFTLVGLATSPRGENFEMNRFLIRPTYLLGLGYMIASWGSCELHFKRRLALLKEVSTLSNPRFGVERTISAIVERLRDFYGADTCFLVMTDGTTQNYEFYCSDQTQTDSTTSKSRIEASFANQWLQLPDDQAVIYSRRRSLWRRQANIESFDVAQGRPAAGNEEVIRGLAEALEAEAFASIPLHHQTRMVGRIFFVMKRPVNFNYSDISFILQVIKHIIPTIENVRLVDRLASDAAESERQRIAHNIHDSVIQCHLGLQAGLHGIRQKVLVGSDVTQDLEKLIAFTGVGIVGLREYVEGLRSPSQLANSLVSAIQRYAKTFSEFTNIQVQLDMPSQIGVPDRLAAEVFQMVTEGLSNVRRHTEATKASISVRCIDDILVLRIENECDKNLLPEPFTPRSIDRRAAALGGETRVVRNREGKVAVVVKIPL
jgi:signal transduction histidine kinase